MTSSDNRPYVAITMGDPAGIGPEVTAKALTDHQVSDNCLPFVIGNTDIMKAAFELSGSGTAVRTITDVDEVMGEPSVVDVLDIGNLDHSGVSVGCVSAAAGKASVEWVLKAGELAASGHISAIVTAPINKEASSLAGYKDIGHMEIFQRQTGAKEVATMLVADVLRVVHLTTHKSLRIACDFANKDNVLSKIILTDEYFKKWGYSSPRIGVAALNPHASDGGLIGNEEEVHITPAISEAQSLGVDATGPVPPDTIFNQAVDGKFDVVIAMYHDQGHIAIKMHNWAQSISVNLGLPFVRTSVDHGTAFDIAGKGVADHESMREALRVAVGLANGSKLG